MATLHPDPRYGDYVAYIKGAPDMLLELSDQVIENGTARPLTDAIRRRVLEVNERLASDALRVLGVAFMLLQSKRTLDECPVLLNDGAFADRRAQLAALVSVGTD